MKMNKYTALLVIVALTILTSFSSDQKDPKLKKIFNGKNLDGWVSPEGNIWWKADKGILTAQSDIEKKGSILWTKEAYTNFIIQVDFKFGAGTVDSGIFIRTENEQIQIGESGSLKRDMTGSPYIPGKSYPVEAENIKELLKMSDWNTMKVKALGSVYTVWLNGKVVLTYDSQISNRKRPGWTSVASWSRHAHRF